MTSNRVDARGTMLRKAATSGHQPHNPKDNMTRNGVDFTEFDHAALELSWTWLNDPDIKRLTLTPDFSREQQEAWFSSLPLRPDYLIWAVRYNRQPIGAVGLKHIHGGRAEYWGYIGERTFWGLGIGRMMVAFALAEARNLKLGSVYLKAGHDNDRALRLYKQMGFKPLHQDDRFCEMEIKL